MSSRQMLSSHMQNPTSRTRMREIDRVEESLIQKRVAVAGPSREELDEAKETAKFCRESEKRLHQLLRFAEEVNEVNEQLHRQQLHHVRELLQASLDNRENNEAVVSRLDKMSKVMGELRLHQARRSNEFTPIVALAVGFFLAGFVVNRSALQLLTNLMVLGLVKHFYTGGRDENSSPEYTIENTDMEL
ncbi:hypothetical protein EV421DRAFT_1736300 [Armillaria borealis]|uniref:Uncharacterized protein n=1 Tax=Armillaria borealis TaxID=47425 RepID=A0AA39JGP1_9AGAR|nr:hypothetical protein EV421DRAFT_1736300 [Armillaria borealis]